MWLGLKAIHALTQQGTEFHVYLETFEGEAAYAHYTHFAVGDASSNYGLSVSGYRGTAGDSMDHHNNYPFSTKDNDNDPSGGNCAETYHGAWWYNNCHNSNLNGQYYMGAHADYAVGINWAQYKGFHYSYRKAVMKVKKASE